MNIKILLTYLKKFIPDKFIYAYKKAGKTYLSLRNGCEPVHWSRVVMNQETRKFIESLNYEELDAAEVSGNDWETVNFKSYKILSYPKFDICGKNTMTESFDLVFAEQVLEHVAYPKRAVENIYDLLRPGGHCVITTPFLVRVHNEPMDCWRWTELGLKHLLAEGGFDLKKIRTGSWGNRECVVANFDRWVYFNRKIHSLVNEKEFPISVWAMAQR